MAEKKPAVPSDAEKLEKAKEFKSEGNECHKNKDFRRAIGKYHRSLLQLKAIGQAKSSGLAELMSEDALAEKGFSSHVPPEVQSEITKIMGDCYNNLAACLLQQESTNFEKVLEYCNRVVELAPQNIKGHYRRGLAYYNLNNFEKALESFNQAASVSRETKDQAFKALLSKQLKLCQEGLKEDDKKLGSVYRGMFDRTAGEDTSHGDKG